MTKAEFKEWLQNEFEKWGQPGPATEDKGDEWRLLEARGILSEAKVEYAWDYINHDMIFRCSDGLLVSGYEIGIEQETIWFFAEGLVENNMRDYTERELGSAIGQMEDALEALQKV